MEALVVGEEFAATLGARSKEAAAAATLLVGSHMNWRRMAGRRSYSRMVPPAEVTGWSGVLLAARFFVARSHHALQGCSGARPLWERWASTGIGRLQAMVIGAPLAARHSIPD
jgi:hypothetical protein